jgi:hypothetical protein
MKRLRGLAIPLGLVLFILAGYFNRRIEGGDLDPGYSLIGLILQGAAAVVLVAMIAKGFARRKANRLCYTGDQHPFHKFLAFVEYGEQGEKIWTSVYGDTEAPYRLVKLSAQRRAAGTRISPHSTGT